MSLPKLNIVVAAIIFLASAMSAAAQESDAALLSQLESAPTDREYLEAVIAVNQRLESGPLDPAYADRIVDELASSLAREWTLRSSTTGRVVKAVQDSGRPLTDAAVESLFSALGHRAMLNRSAAIELLSTVPADHPRRSEAVDAFSVLLSSHEHQHTRTSAAMALKDLGQDAPLPESAVATLINAVHADDYVTVRIDAADALSYQALERSRAESVTQPLAAELIKPTEVTRQARGLVGFGHYPGRARDLLSRMYSSPYPAHVVDVWISQLGAPNYPGALELLRAAVVRDELSADQYQRLRTAARTAHAHDQRIDIYATSFAGTTAADLAEAKQVLETQSSVEDRLMAAHRLYSYHRENGIPPVIADIATAQLTGEPDTEVARALALLMIDSVDSEKRGEQLVDGLIAHAEDPQMWGPVIPLLSLEHLELLIVRAVSDEEMPVSYRYMVLNDFESRAENGGTMSDDVAETLETAARSSKEYRVSQAAGEALAAWGGRKPLNVKLSNRRNQSAALGYLFLGLGILNLGAGIAGFISILVMPLQSKEGSSTALKRTGLVIGWLLLSFVMLILIGIGFIGFLGHNSAPPPSDSFMLNLPLYFGSLIFLPLAWHAVRRARQRAST